MSLTPGMAFLLATVLFVGLTLVIVGVRGRVLFSSPRCTRCGYDLRAVNFMQAQDAVCPECGQGLSKPGAAVFGRRHPMPWIAISGIAVLAVGLIAPAILPRRNTPAIVRVMTSVRPTPAPPPRLPTTAELIAAAQDAPDTHHPAWRKLSEVHGAGRLTSGELETIVSALADTLRHTRNGTRQYSSLSPSEIALGILKDSRSPLAHRMLLTGAMFGDPAVQIRKRARESKPIFVRVDFSSCWDLEGLTLCSALRNVTADNGISLEMESPFPRRGETKSLDRFSGFGSRSDWIELRIDQSLLLGKHVLTFTFDGGLIERSRVLRGADGKVGQKSKWPDPLVTWERIVKIPIVIVGPDESVIDSVTDLPQNPVESIKLSVRDVVVRPKGEFFEIVVGWQSNRAAPQLPLCYHVVLESGSHRYDVGVLKVLNQGLIANSSSIEYTPLPRNFQQAKVKLIPYSMELEKQVDINAMWGTPYEFESVPVQRFDLPQVPTTGGSAQLPQAENFVRNVGD